MLSSIGDLKMPDLEKLVYGPGSFRDYNLL